jgi:hypothetical protein
MSIVRLLGLLPWPFILIPFMLFIENMNVKSFLFGLQNGLLIMQIVCLLVYYKVIKWEFELGKFSH